MADKSFARKYGLEGKGLCSRGKDREDLAEEIEVKAAGEIRMKQSLSGAPLTMIQCDIQRICRMILDSIYDLDNGKGATPRDVSLQTGFSLGLVMLVFKYEKHRIRSQWCFHEVATRYKIVE